MRAVTDTPTVVINADTTAFYGGFPDHADCQRDTVARVVAMFGSRLLILPVLFFCRFATDHPVLSCMSLRISVSKPF